MGQLSLGLIETVGLAAAIEAADAALKSANVALVGYELTRGDGMVAVKVEGEVGAIKAAVDAAAVAAARVNRVVSTHVIARPADGLSGLVSSRDTVGVRKAALAKVSSEPEGGGAIEPPPPVAEAPPSSDPTPAPEAVASPVKETPAAHAPATVTAPSQVVTPIKKTEEPSAAVDEAVRSASMDKTTPPALEAKTTRPPLAASKSSGAGKRNPRHRA